MSKSTIAAGFDFEPLPDGTVQLEFYDEDGATCSSQIVTHEILERMPTVIALTLLFLDQGREVVEEFLRQMRKGRGKAGEEV